VINTENEAAMEPPSEERRFLLPERSSSNAVFRFMKELINGYATFGRTKQDLLS
jgi:hypothetical protein